GKVERVGKGFAAAGRVNHQCTAALGGPQSKREVEASQRKGKTARLTIGALKVAEATTERGTTIPGPASEVGKDWQCVPHFTGTVNKRGILPDAAQTHHDTMLFLTKCTEKLMRLYHIMQACCDT